MNQYIKKPTKTFDLKLLFPQDDAAVDLLYSMFTYNPYLRPTATECLKHSYFDNIRHQLKRPYRESKETFEIKTFINNITP